MLSNYFCTRPYFMIFPMLMLVSALTSNAAEFTMKTDSSTEVKVNTDDVSLEISHLRLTGKRTYEVKIPCGNRDKDACMDRLGTLISKVVNPDADTQFPYLNVYLSLFSDVSVQLFDSVPSVLEDRFERSAAAGDLKEIKGKYYLRVGLSKDNIRSVKFITHEFKFSVTFESFARYSKESIKVACANLPECLQSKRVIETYKTKSAELIFEKAGKFSRFLGERVSIANADGSLKYFSIYRNHSKYKSLGDYVTRDETTGLVWGSKVTKTAENSTDCDPTTGPDCWMTSFQAGQYCLSLNKDFDVVQDIGLSFKNNENPKNGIYLPSYSEYYQLAVHEGYDAMESRNKFRNYPIEQSFYSHINRDVTTAPPRHDLVNILFSSELAKMGMNPKQVLEAPSRGPFICVGRF